VGGRNSSDRGSATAVETSEVSSGAPLGGGSDNGVRGTFVLAFFVLALGIGRFFKNVKLSQQAGTSGTV
jgi:hypothetical protein